MWHPRQLGYTLNYTQGLHWQKTTYESVKIVGYEADRGWRDLFARPERDRRQRAGATAALPRERRDAPFREGPLKEKEKEPESLVTRD